MFVKQTDEKEYDEVIQPSLGEAQAKWQTFEKPENKKNYGSQSIQAWLPYMSLVFRFLKCLPFQICLS